VTTTTAEGTDYDLAPGVDYKPAQFIVGILFVMARHGLDAGALTGNDALGYNPRRL